MPGPIPKLLLRRAAVGRGRALRIAGVAALLAGCTVGPDFTRPAEPQDNSYTATPIDLAVSDKRETEQRLALGQKISGDWWELLRSPKLTGVLQQAIADNKNLIAAKATLAQAQEAVNQAAGGKYPQVNLAGGVSRQKPNLAAQGINQTSPIFNLYTIGPNLTLPLDLFGGITRQVEQQQAMAEFEEHQLNAAYLTLTGNAVNQAVQIASARAQIKAVESIIADDERNLKSIRTQLAVQEATRIDLESARSQLASDRTLLPPLRQQLSVARHALSVLVGKAPAEWSPPDFDLAEFALPQDLPVSLPSQLVRQRPDVLAAEAQLHSASAAIGVATAQLYPNITLSASFTQEALTTGPLFAGASSLWSIASQVTAPIFHGGSLEAQKHGAEDAFEATLATYQQTVLQSFGQVADALQALAHDAELVAGQHEALDSAQASADLTRDSYDAGNANVLQVLDAQRLLEQARLGYVRATAQRYQDTAQLFIAMGGGWWNWRPEAGRSPNDIGS
jgi:NodT family efflux transporter outer membrane factor (OMF) lipoprotein